MHTDSTPQIHQIKNNICHFPTFNELAFVYIWLLKPKRKIMVVPLHHFPSLELNR